MSLLQMSFYGAVLILAIVILRAIALHKLPKKVFVLLWGIALLRLLVPFSIPSEFSLYSILPLQLAVEDLVLEDSSDKTGFPVPAPAVSTDVPSAVPVTGITDGNRLFIPLWNIFWLLGFLFVALFFCITYFRYRREFATSLPVKEEAILSWKNNHPLKWAYEIRQSDKISAPLTYGILHPVILLPKSIDCENIKQLHYILLHEHTHIRHLDTLTKLLIIVTVCFHWFNPLVWVLYLLFNRDIEFYCDECVMSLETDDSRSAYANTLIHMEEARGFSMPLCNHFSKTAIEERIVSVMKTRKTTFGMILSGVFVVTLLSITLLTDAKTAYGSQTSLPLPTVTATPTPTPGPVVTPPPTVAPTRRPVVTPPPTVAPTRRPEVSTIPTVSPENASTPKVQLTSGELYTLACTMFEQFRQTMNTEIYQSPHYPETYRLTVWKHNENHLSIDYQFLSGDLSLESGILSLYKVDGTWKVVAYLPDVNPN